MAAAPPQQTAAAEASAYEQGFQKKVVTVEKNGMKLQVPPSLLHLRIAVFSALKRGRRAPQQVASI